jgi:O-antigen/teichoic acid export membrane protein
MLSKLHKYKSHLKISFLYLGSSLIVSLIGILINPLLAKNLSPEDYAIIGYFTSFQLLLTPLVSFNLTTYYLRNYSRIPEERRQIVSDTILIGQIFIGFSSLVLFTTALYFYCFWTKVNYPFFPYAIYTFAQIYVSIFTTFYLIKLRINREANKFAWVTVINSLVTTALTLLLVVYYKEGADGKLLSAFIAALIAAIYSIGKAIGKWQFDVKILKEALKFGLPLTISALFWYFLTGVDRAMLIKLDDTYTYGIYIVAIQITAYMTIFYTTVNNTFEPDIYQAIAENNKIRLMKLMGVIIGFITIVNLVFIFFAPTAIGLLTANRYIASAPFSQILAVQNITMACYYMVVKLFIGYGYVKAELAVRIIGAAFSVFMFKMLIDDFGFYGAAWGQVFSFLGLSVLGLVTLYFLNKKTYISLSMASKNTIMNSVLMLVMSLIFITPLGYVHYTALVLLLPFLVISGNKKWLYDKETLLLIFFSLSYTLVLILNRGLESGIGTLLKYLFVPILCYQAGKYFVEYSKNDKSFIDNLSFLLFSFSLIVFLSMAKDISEVGYISTTRNIAVIGGGDDINNATRINAILSVWLVMFGFVFYQTQYAIENKRKLLFLLISIIAIAFTLRLGSRTGLVVIGVSSFAVITYNFRRYSYIRKLWLIILVTVVVIGIGNFIANNEEVLIAYADRADSEEFGASTGGGRTQLWEYFGSKILDYPMGDMPTNETKSPYAHNYFIDVARVSGIIPLICIILFTISVLRNFKKLLFNANISIFIRNLILVLNVSFYMVFMVEPIIEGCFSLFMLYTFTCGINSRLINISLAKNDR